MIRESDIVAIIPARGGSKGIPRKNVKLLCGKPLIYYTINEAKKSKYLCRLIVSTEDGEIAEAAKKFKAEVIERPAELARDDTPSFLVCQHVIRYLEEIKNFYPDVVVVLQPTSPRRIVEDVDRAIEKFLEADCDTVVSVCEAEHPPHWMYTLEGDRMKPVIPGGEKIFRRRDAPKVYRLNGAVYVTSRDIIMNENRVLGNDTRAYIMPIERSIDIDTELDFQFADLLMKKGERR